MPKLTKKVSVPDGYSYRRTDLNSRKASLLKSAFLSNYKQDLVKPFLTINNVKEYLNVIHVMNISLLRSYTRFFCSTIE